MKKLICIVFVMFICSNLIGCNASKYEEALGLMEQGNYSEAKEILVSLGDYEDSLQLVAEIEDRENYQKAISLFKNGDFGEAKSLFTNLLNNDEYDIQRYLTAIDSLSKITGSWQGEFECNIDYSSYSDQLVSGTITCKIGAPFTISTSHMSGCDWAATATIELTSNCYVLSRGSLNYKTFSIKDQEGFHHLEEENDTKLNDSMITLYNENMYEFLYMPNRGTFSVITLGFKNNFSELELWELPCDITWSSLYPSDSHRETISKAS